MFGTFLILHSLIRWLVLLSLLVSLFLSYRGWLQKRSFSPFDARVQNSTLAIGQIQFLIGLYLYLISPIVRYFYQHWPDSIHDTQIRFFGMEHITMMVLAIAGMQITNAVSKRKTSDRQKFKTWAIGYSIVFVTIFLSIPWAFSPFTARPYFRFF